MAGPDLARLLGSLTVAAEGAQAHQRPASWCHQIVDFVSSSLFAEEEVALGDGGTLKLHPKPEVDKVSPAMWITASSRIIGQMLDESGKNSDVRAYLQYTEMVESWRRATRGSPCSSLTRSTDNGWPSKTSPGEPTPHTWAL